MTYLSYNLWQTKRPSFPYWSDINFQITDSSIFKFSFISFFAVYYCFLNWIHCATTTFRRFKLEIKLFCKFSASSNKRCCSYLINWIFYWLYGLIFHNGLFSTQKNFSSYLVNSICFNLVISCCFLREIARFKLSI